MARISYITSFFIIILFAFVSAAPFSPAARLKSKVAKFSDFIHRIGNQKSVLGGGVRDKDWNKQGGMVHPDATKGLSMNRILPTTSEKKHVVHSIHPDNVSPEFKVVHDGKDIHPDSKHPIGHSTMAYVGAAPITGTELKTKLNEHPWVKTPHKENK